jgi:histidinol-phosphatase (PHP family)
MDIRRLLPKISGMALPADYHMHTPLCRHATGEPTEYAACARARGLTEIGFSDHSPMPRDDFDDWRMSLSQLDAYVESVRHAQRDHPGLAIKLALEVDYLPGQEGWVGELAGRHPWDYLIGSVHYVNDTWDVDNPKKIAEWREHDPVEVWTWYFERLTQAADSGLFDILGHADLPKKFGAAFPADGEPMIELLLAAARRRQVALELNTAGLRKDCREIYPSRRILELAWRDSVPITFGSDAHAPGEVGMDFDQAVALARSVGYTHACRFSRRQREVWRL